MGRSEAGGQFTSQLSPPASTPYSPSTHLSELGFDDTLALFRQGVLEQGVQVGPEHTCAQAGLQLGAVVVHQEEVIVQGGCCDVATDTGSPCKVR